MRMVSITRGVQGVYARMILIKYTIRISKEFHESLKNLIKEHGTLENALNKIYEFWKERKIK